MVFPVVGGDGKPTGYDIDNSLRFEDGDAPRLTKTFSSSGNRRTVTFSAWFKLSNLGIIRHIFSNNGADFINLESDDTLSVQLAGSAEGYIYSNRKFRDVSAWYHIVVAVDTTQGTASNRIKLYINGVQETSFSDSTNPDQNLQTGFAENVQHAIGMRSANVDRHFDGYLAEVNFVDGSALDPTYFGETDDNGVWIPKEPDVSSYGTNGFYMQFQQTGTSANSSGIGADTSGNDNHFAVTNLAATDVTTDTPTNNFCTMNPLMSFAGASDGIDAFSEGNTVVDSNNDTSAAGSTFGVKNGKWYYEAKLTTGNQSSTNFSTGWCQVDYEGQKGTGNGVGFMSGEDNASIDPGGNIIFNNSGSGNQATFGNRSTNDIFQVAVDLDNNKMWFGVNGTWSNGSASQSTTFDASNSDFSSIFDTAGVDYMPAFAQTSSGQTVLAYNFGNPSYSISSGNADANGYGNFEYPVPSGFYSLCTKNLAEFG
jgi:hypothetical protein